MTLSISRLLLNPRNRLTSDSLSKGQAVLCNCYKELKLYEAVIVNRFNNYGDSVAILTPEQEQEKLIIVSMHGILLMYHRVMDDWDMMSVEQEYDHSEMASFFGSEKKEEVDVVLPDLEQQILIVEEEPSVMALSQVAEDIIYTSILRCSPKAMKVLAVIIINQKVGGLNRPKWVVLLYRCEVIKLVGTSYRLENRKTIFCSPSADGEQKINHRQTKQ